MKGVRVTPQGTVIDQLDINVWDNDQLLPELAFDGSNYLIAWADRRGIIEQLYHTRVTAGGTVLDPNGTRLPCQDSTQFQLSPAVASNGTSYYLAWLAGAYVGTMVYGVRLGLDGTVLDSAPIQFTSDTLFQNRVVVGTDGQNYLVLWCGETPGQVGDDLYCCRIGPDGRLLDSLPRLVCRTAQGINDPAVAFLQDRYLVVWADMCAGSDIYASRVLQDGTVLDPNGFPVCSRPDFQREPEVAACDDRWLVVWTDMAATDFDIHGALVDTSGTVGLDSRSGMTNPEPRFTARPNPASNRVAFVVEAPGTEIEVYDCSGRLVRRLPVHRGTASWDRLDEQNRPVPAGVYLARNPAGPGSATCRVVLVD